MNPREGQGFFVRLLHSGFQYTFLSPQGTAAAEERSAKEGSTQRRVPHNR